MFQNRGKAKYLVISVLLLALGALGCATDVNETPMSPIETVSFEFVPGEFLPNPNVVKFGTAHGSHGPDIGVQFGLLDGLVSLVQVIIGPLGGRVVAPFGVLDFPVGAVSAFTTVTMELDSNGYLIVDCGPEGTEFGAPVELRLNLEGTNAEGRADACAVGYWDPERGAWQVLPTQVEDENTIKADLEHFSRYGGLIGG